MSGRVRRRQDARWAQQDYQQGGYQEVQPAPAAPVAPADPVQQLKELAELRDSGVLTEEEFAAQKAKILG